jgi:hypothetical protein
VYATNPQWIRPFDVIKRYPTISGSSMLKDGNTLIVANKQGLFFYDITDLRNIEQLNP